VQPAGEIIVTARRQEERLQDVPLSVVVVNQTQLTNNNVRSVMDLATIAPSLTVNTLFGADNAKFSIRGFSQASRTAAAVGVYFDEVVAPRAGNGSTSAGDGAGQGEMFDLQNVQVLNGPQGTLFGRNTTGGSVLIVSHKPTDRLEGYVEGSYGNYNARGVQAVINIPISDAVKFRAGINGLKRDGFLKNLSGIGPSAYSDQNYIGYRASLIVDIAPNLENYTVVHGYHSENNGPMQKLTACTNTFPFGLLACQQMAREAGQGFYTVSGALPNAHVWMAQWQAINTTSWNVNDHFSIKNIFSYSQISGQFVEDILGANYIIPTGAFGPLPSTGIYAGMTLGFAQSTHGVGINQHDQKNWVEELRFQGEAFGNHLNWQGGFYYEKSDPRAPSGTQSPNVLACSNSETFQCIDVFGGLLRRAVGIVNTQVGEVSFLNKAIYGQMTYAVNDKLRLTGGLRYTWDTSSASAQLYTYRNFSVTTVPNTPLQTCTLAGLPGVSADCRTSTATRSEAPTWLLSADYKLSPDTMVYASYSRGYRQGSVTYNAPPPYQATQPEHVDAYEVGAKMKFDAPMPVIFNVAAFYNNLVNQQISVNLQSSINATTPTSTVQNAGSSTIAGVEGELTVRPSHNLTIDANYEYLHTKVKSLNTTPLVGSVYDIVQPTATTGSRLPFTPIQKWTVTGSYHVPMSESLGEITASATYSWTGNYVYTTGQFGVIPAVGLLNATLTWRSVMQTPVDISLFGTNLTGTKYFTTATDLRPNGGFVSQVVGEPRMFGVRARYTFGR
jgi:iron complex outermembrane receptor protein